MYYSEKIDGKHYQTFAEIERQVILIRLEKLNYSRRLVAKSLNKSTRYVHGKINQYRLEGHVIPDDPYIVDRLSIGSATLH